MIRPQRYWVVALKRAAITSITSRQTGNCSAIILADNSVSTIADDSSGSRKPAASPTATQLRFQKVSRWPERNLMRRTVRPSGAGPGSEGRRVGEEGGREGRWRWGKYT